jgi:tripartite-type tricarboxylate transporter receptor subunit TctC
VTAELFKVMTGVQMTHVPFKGSAPSIVALMGGQVDLSFSSVAITLPQIKAERIRALAVTSQRRSTALPQLPTMVQAGLRGFESQQWFALFGPAALPSDIIERLSSAIMRWLDSPGVRTRLASEGAEPGNLALDELASFIRGDATRWTKVIKASRATPD